jgi:hypothetical protein
MTDRQSREKAEEKEEEKEEEKRHEKEEKTSEEKWRRDPVGGLVGAVVLIWIGVVLLAANVGWLQEFGLRNEIPMAEPQTWAIILLGAAAITLLGVLARVLVPAYRRPIGGSIVFAAILVAVGIGLWTSWDWGQYWPVVLVVIGVAIILGGLLRRRK